MLSQELYVANDLKLGSIPRVNILILGLYNSGSSAVLNLLQEYDGVGSIPGEFNDFRRPGMIGDTLLGRVPHDYSSRLPVQRRPLARCWQYLRGLSNKSRKVKYRRSELLVGLAEQLETSNSHDAKIKLVQDWIKALAELYAPGQSLVVFDQPLLIADHYEVWPSVFHPFKVIFVYRDPRDQIANMVKKNQLYLQFGSRMVFKYGGGRVGALRMEIDILKDKLNWIQKFQLDHGSDKVLILSFENLVRRYEESTKAIESFLELSNKAHTRKGTRLVPTKSQQNIGLFKDYIRDSEMSLFDEVRKLYHEMEIGFDAVGSVLSQPN
jgi:hypothetical protein